MKKAVKSIAAVFVVVALCLGLLAGCADSSTSPVGIWKISGAQTLGMDVPLDKNGYHEQITITLNADGTVTTFGEKVGTWTHKGSALTIVENGITLNCEYNGSSFVTVVGGVTTTYSRTDSPYPY